MKVETQQGAAQPLVKKEPGLKTKYQTAMEAKAKRKQERQKEKERDALEKQKKRQEKMRILFTKDGKAILRSPLCLDARFNYMKAINDFKCEWIYTKKIEGKTRNFTCSGSDLKLLCLVNARMKEEGVPLSLPEVGSSYEAAKKKGFQETFLHPDFLEPLNVGQTKLINAEMQNVPAETLREKGKKRKREEEEVEEGQESELASKRVKVTPVSGMETPKKKKIASPSPVLHTLSSATPTAAVAATQGLNSSQQRSLLNLQNEGFELLQNLSTWMMKVSDAICVKNTAIKKFN